MSTWISKQVQIKGYKCVVMSSLRSRWLWRGNLKKFPSVPLISLQALRRSCWSKVRSVLSARVREHWLEVMEVCLSLPWEIPTKWKASLRFSSCILYYICITPARLVKRHRDDRHLICELCLSSRIGVVMYIIIFHWTTKCKLFTVMHADWK